MKILRKEIWKHNLARITEQNKRFKKGEVSYKMSQNHFSHMTVKELQETLSCVNADVNFYANWLTVKYSFLDDG